MTERPRHAPPLASPSNPRIRAASALRERRARDATGLTVVDGAREIRRALDAGVDVVEAFVCEPLLAGPDARAAFDGLRRREATGLAVHRTTEAAFAKLAFGDRAEGVVAVIRPASLALSDLVVSGDPLLVVVEGVEKPGNLGAVLRSADGAGADAVIAASARTDLTNPNVIRASAGTLFSMAMAEADSVTVLTWLRDRSFHIYAARVEASASYTEVDLTGPVALVLGAEDRGLTATWAGDDIEAIHLPMAGVADSLNVSVTAAVLLYEARRQRDRLRAEPAD